jgi:hypothetical protein
MAIAAEVVDVQSRANSGAAFSLGLASLDRLEVAQVVTVERDCGTYRAEAVEISRPPLRGDFLPVCPPRKARLPFGATVLAVGPGRDRRRPNVPGKRINHGLGTDPGCVPSCGEVAGLLDGGLRAPALSPRQSIRAEIGAPRQRTAYFLRA